MAYGYWRCQSCGLEKQIKCNQQSDHNIIDVMFGWHIKFD